MWGSKVVVPPSGRASVLEELHDSHLGASKMKSLTRAYIWWPKLDSDIENLARSCTTCQQTSALPTRAPLHPWEWPSQPWSRLHLDFAGPFLGHMYLVTVDAYSKWLDVQIMKSITSENTIAKLKDIFTTHGLPQKIVTDNGSSFTSSTFKTFMAQNGIKHICTAPYHPSSNGLAERAVQTFKQSLRQIQGGSVKEKLTKFLFKYRITPHTVTGVAPAELLMGRRLRSRLDLLKPNIAATVEHNQLKQKLNRDGQRPYRVFDKGGSVYIQDFTANKQKWIPGTIQKATGPVSYVVLLADGSTARRHVDNIKARYIAKSTVEDSVDYSTLQPTSNETETCTEATSEITQTEAIKPVTTSTPDNAAVPELVIATRPTRIRQPPKRFKDFVATEEVRSCGEEM